MTPTTTPPTGGRKAKISATELEALRRLAKGLDTRFRIPGTPIRFGWESIVGLIPVVGDSATGIISLLIVGQAWRAGVSRGVLAQMVTNVLIDVAVGAVPLAGDVFDLFWKANVRNMRLLERSLERQGAAVPKPSNGSPE